MQVKIHWTQRASKVEEVLTSITDGTSGKDSIHLAQEDHSVLNSTTTRDYIGDTHLHLARRENAGFATVLYRDSLGDVLECLLCRLPAQCSKSLSKTSLHIQYSGGWGAGWVYLVLFF
ncbi:hypothetical protein AB205_0057070 [Aquarana catesbeiana]|uniref:Uncharacterized protein n=1 Tax=Aquarana catesbeiana TaxID=8400 RepID=A0A2G9PSQ7_AQUCT|nr:hypothetical protein AB205_0057070 [Aquarana catesbeiana]